MLVAIWGLVPASFLNPTHPRQAMREAWSGVFVGYATELGNATSIHDLLVFLVVGTFSQSLVANRDGWRGWGWRDASGSRGGARCSGGLRGWRRRRRRRRGQQGSTLGVRVLEEGYSRSSGGLQGAGFKGSCRG